MIWITSDLHFGHTKSFLYEPRGFSSIEEHDSAIIKNWNERVKPEDIVYVLGDCMLSGDDAANLEKLASLNGHKHLILGNHDTEAKQLLYKGIFETIQYASMIKHGRWNFYLSHYPTNVGNFMREKHHKKFYCLCGHSHTQNKFIDFQNTKSYHVELDAHNNCPVLLDDIIKDIIKIHSDDRCFTCPYYLYCNEEATVCGLKKGKK